MTRILRLSVALFAGVAGVVSFVRAADVEPIVAPAKRADVLEQARKLLATKQPAEKVSNPFFTTSFGDVLAGAATDRTANPSGEATAPTTGEGTPAPRVENAGPKNVLQAIATSLKPRYLEMGGQPMLYFGQKRVKAGGLLTITFEGKEYTLEVVTIDRTNFTLRLNREEFTRPIK